MSRAYSPPHLRSRDAPRAGARVTWVLCCATIAAQIAYPLVPAGSRAELSIVTVVLFFVASVTHAAVQRGAFWAAGLVVVAAGVGLAAEAVGVATGVPFGRYAYGDDLGPKAFDVPVLVPMAWTMFAYPALLVGRRLAGRMAVVAWPIGALALASWDVFLDPQMVAEGHWRWSDPTPALPGVPGIPLTNFAGWVAVALVIIGLLHALLPPTRADDRVPATLFLWTYFSNVLANAVFFDRPGVAVAGGIAMGLVAVPYAVSLWRERP